MILMQGRSIVASPVLSYNDVILYLLEGKVNAVLVPNATQVPIEGKCLFKRGLHQFFGHTAWESRLF